MTSVQSINSIFLVMVYNRSLMGSKVFYYLLLELSDCEPDNHAQEEVSPSPMKGVRQLDHIGLFSKSLTWKPMIFIRR